MFSRTGALLLDDNLLGSAGLPAFGMPLRKPLVLVTRKRTLGTAAKVTAYLPTENKREMSVIHCFSGLCTKARQA